MSVTLLKALVAFVPVGVLLAGSVAVTQESLHGFGFDFRPALILAVPRMVGRRYSMDRQ
jgi:hypothetical protein